MNEPIPNPHAQTLFTLALQDESTLQFPLPDAIFGFYAQQSCEKLLKALLSARNQQYPFKHSLERLLQMVQDLNEPCRSSPAISRCSIRSLCSTGTTSEVRSSD